MTREELFEITDIDEPSDFAYFEQMAALIENEEPVSQELFEEILSEVDSEAAAELIENYFEDLSNAVPDDENELVSLIDSVKQNLVMAAQSIDDVNSRADFVQQLYYFYEWFHADRMASVDTMPCSVFYAVTEHRVEKLGEAAHKYDFSEACSSYELDDISMGLGSYSKIDILKDKADDDNEC